MRAEGLTVQGGDVVEAFILAADPTARSKDRLLLMAKLVAKYAKATHFSDSELRGAAWFARLPEVSGDISDIVFDEANYLTGSFWAAWKRDPDAVLRLVKLIRDRVKQHEGVSMTSQLVMYSDSKTARWKRAQRQRQALTPPPNVKEFATRLRQL